MYSPIDVFHFLQIDLRAYDRWLQNFCMVDRDFLPFGLISRDVIEQAKLILNEIRFVDLFSCLNCIFVVLTMFLFWYNLFVETKIDCFKILYL